MRILQGKAISPGYAKGKAFIYSKSYHPPVPRYSIEPRRVDDEHLRVDQALEQAFKELRNLQMRVLIELGQGESEIFSAHMALLNDQQFLLNVKERINRDLVNAEHAVSEEIAYLSRSFQELENEYLRERAKDVEDIGRRVVKNLGHGPEERLLSLEQGSVVVARDLLPSDTLNLDRNHVNGLVLEHGGNTSHSAILARAMGIPAVSGIARACTQIPLGAEVLVDGKTGMVTIVPGEIESNLFYPVKREYDQESLDALSAKHEECLTMDGVKISLLGNIGRPDEAEDIRKYCLDGVGLFRTEYLFLRSIKEPPSLETQLAAYREAMERLAGLPIVIRTLDLGGDKKPPFLLPRFENNPNLGVRGLRFSLLESDMFHTQLLSILRATENHDVGVLFPMVASSSDLERAIDELKKAALKCGAERIPKVGAMIETPSSLFELNEILQLVDFLSLGTNDLLQFMLAADRNAVEILNDESILQPAMLRAIAKVVQAGREKGKPVCVCGEAAGNPKIACLLAGLGIREFSMSPIRAARVRYAFRNCSLEELEHLAQEALRRDSQEKVVFLLEEGFQGKTLVDRTDNRTTSKEQRRGHA